MLVGMIHAKTAYLLLGIIILAVEKNLLVYIVNFQVNNFNSISSLIFKIEVILNILIFFNAVRIYIWIDFFAGSILKIFIII